MTCSPELIWIQASNLCLILTLPNPIANTNMSVTMQRLDLIFVLFLLFENRSGFQWNLWFFVCYQILHYLVKVELHSMLLKVGVLKVSSNFQKYDIRNSFLSKSCYFNHHQVWNVHCVKPRFTLRAPYFFVLLGCNAKPLFLHLTLMCFKFILYPVIF